jgi:uncharacterized membrane protein
VEAYSLIKLAHIVSASILFGTGIGTAFFMLRAHQSKCRDAMAVTIRNVVLADWIFTTPAIMIQLATGMWLTIHLSIPLSSAWFVSVISLFAFVGACWIPVVFIQIKIKRIIGNGGSSSEYDLLMRAWIALGVLAFTGVLMLFFIMVAKPGIGTILPV